MMVIENSARFPCDCGTPGHAIDLSPDVVGDELILCVTLWHDPPSLKDRIKTAWDALWGKPQIFSEVFLRGQTAQAFVSYVGKIQSQTNTTITVSGGGTYRFINGSWSETQ